MGMMDNTLVVLASDNGGCPSSGGSNFPYRGFKHTLFEGGVRTPAFVYSKSKSIIPEEVSKTRELNELNRVAFIKCTRSKALASERLCSNGRIRLLVINNKISKMKPNTCRSVSRSVYQQSHPNARLSSDKTGLFAGACFSFRLEDDPLNPFPLRDNASNGLSRREARITTE